MAEDRGQLAARIIANLGMILFLIPAAVIAGVALAEVVMGGGFRTGMAAAISAVAWISGVLILRKLPKRAPRPPEDEGDR